MPKRRVGASGKVSNVHNIPRTALSEGYRTLVNIVPIVDFITGLCKNTFNTIVKDPEHRPNSLIPFSGPSRYALRCNRRFVLPKCNARQIVLGIVLLLDPVLIIYIYIYIYIYVDF